MDFSTIIYAAISGFILGGMFGMVLTAVLVAGRETYSPPASDSPTGATPSGPAASDPRAAGLSSSHSFPMPATDSEIGAEKPRPGAESHACAGLSSIQQEA